MDESNSSWTKVDEIFSGDVNVQMVECLAPVFNLVEKSISCELLRDKHDNWLADICWRGFVHQKLWFKMAAIFEKCVLKTNNLQLKLANKTKILTVFIFCMALSNYQLICFVWYCDTLNIAWSLGRFIAGKRWQLTDLFAILTLKLQFLSKRNSSCLPDCETNAADTHTGRVWRW